MGEYSVEQISRTVSLMRGLYRRVARRMKCDASYVSRIARGQRRSAEIEAALGKEFRVTLRKLPLKPNPLWTRTN
jgi:transcriptional regulator with XRE-family HTH domain